MGYMNTVDNDCNDIELLYDTTCDNSGIKYHFKPYQLKKLKCGDIFRLIPSEVNRMTNIYSDCEEFVCASDAYRDGLCGWKVILEE